MEQHTPKTIEDIFGAAVDQKESSPQKQASQYQRHKSNTEILDSLENSDSLSYESISEPEPLIEGQPMTREQFIYMRVKLMSDQVY